MTNIGLRTKLISSIVLLVVVFAGFFWFYFPREQERTAERALRERVADTAASLQAFGRVLADMEPFDRRAALERFARNKDPDSDIFYAVFVLPGQGASERELIGYRGAEIPAAMRAYVDGASRCGDDTARCDRPLIHESEEIIQASVTVMKMGLVAGTITVGWSRRDVQHASQRGGSIALLVSLVILAIGVGLSWLVGSGIVTPIMAAARELDSVSNSLVSAAREQEASAAQEAAAVAETRRSMETLLNSAQQIADRSSEVLGNAERSNSGSRQIADRIGDLNELAEKVTELLRVIMQVADKADLLALNASLEGTRAGAAGKGFALVAAEMRRLAENVVESVSGIRELMKDMRETTKAAVSASQEGTMSSTATTHSAREIALLTQEQRQATEQVMASMDEMGDILSHTINGIQRTTLSASQLTDLASTLARMVHPSLIQQRGGGDERSMLSRGGHSDITHDESRF